MESYTSRKIQFSAEFENLKKKYNLISFLRLLCILFALVSLFYYIKTQQSLFEITAIILVIIFIIFIRFHSKLSNRIKHLEALISINENEILFLKKEKIPFENGIDFIDFSHPYSYDLDIFGDNSLFQNLNRTYTFIGKKILSHRLLGILPNDEILLNQVAIKELSKDLDWRQKFAAFAKSAEDNESFYTTLLRWCSFNSESLSRISVVLFFVLPILLWCTLGLYFITSNTIFLSIFSFIFTVNLGYLGLFTKRILLENTQSPNIDKVIKQYGLLLEIIEKKDFDSEKLKRLKQKLTTSDGTSSAKIKQLSELFSRMDSIGNIVAAVIFNGLFLFHFHNLRAIIQWKKSNALALENWLAVIGEFEMLNSLANFTFNNPQFAFPTLNSNYEILFSNLSHPLLNENSRIGNDISFNPQAFTILTGSNMSGKSTFLRSLGVNMVLAGIGAPVCANQANVHPLSVLVSMRLSDSLSDSESYFYAEIKRLKLIIDALNDERSFVLLDEILRGTNSDDKRNGTIEFIKNIINKNAIGVIATHDIEVCLTTDEFPNQLTNRCFEVEISNDDLHFDYKLYNGICKNKSATFLMKKMGVI
jgi:DNA mismatch repair ATPase MutS